MLDMAGNETEVLTIVSVVQYSDSVPVFLAVCAGLMAATAFEKMLGNRLVRMLTPQWTRHVSTFAYIVLGSFIILSDSF